ncbi:MAG: strictosidine synthase family protein [bacterium]
MHKKKIFVFAFLAIVIALAGFVLKTFRDAGEFKQIVPRSFGAVRSLRGVLSSEDITINPLTGIAFISSADRRAQLSGKQPKQGAIFAYDLNDEDAHLRNLTAGFEKAFHPHGITIYVHEDSSVTLFAINHNSDGHFVEVFEERGGRFIHRQSISSPQMFSPNDLVALDANRFYVTNDHGNQTDFGRAIEEYLQLRRSYVLYYDGSIFRMVAEGLAYANGINTSADSKTVYVAATVDGSIHVYDRDLQSGELAFRERIFLNTGVDNIERDTAGDLWVGAHPKLLTFVDYSKDATVLSPSQVLKIHPSADGFQTDDVFIDDGSTLSGSSVAAVYKNNILIGSVFDEKFLILKDER